MFQDKRHGYTTNIIDTDVGLLVKCNNVTSLYNFSFFFYSPLQLPILNPLKDYHYQ